MMSKNSIVPFLKDYLIKFLTRPFLLDTNDFIYENIEIGNDVQINHGANFETWIAKLYIGNKVLFGPNVTIRGGIHPYYKVGQFILIFLNLKKSRR